MIIDILALHFRVKMRRIAVGDIHGCSLTFRYLAEEEIGLSANDILYLLGDYVDRGPDSKGVLDYIIDLVQRDFDYSEKHLKGKAVIHGHQPAYIDTIRERISRRDRIIPLDNGVPYIKKHKIYDHTRLGGLCALDIDSYDLYRTPNRDMQG